MKLNTSSFHTIFRKDLFRFAPLWALYFIGGLMVTLSVVGNTGGTAYMVEAMDGYLVAMGIINMIYAALCAQVLFGDLFNSRLCNALHAMPLRRETWFLSHVAAGLCYSLVPHLAVMLLVSLGMGFFWFVPLLWVAVSALEFLFFFGVAVLSCMCTGNRVAMVLVYAIINFISLLVYGFIQLVYMPQLRGVELDMQIGELFIKFSPVVTLTGSRGYFGFDTNQYLSNLGLSEMIRTFQINWEAWAYPATLAVLGLVALGLALLLYRRRALECAGDFVAVRGLDPAFTVIYTLSVGAVFALLGELLRQSYVPWLLVGLVVGYFTGRMLLGRTVRVFRLRNLLYCGIFMAAMGLSIWITALDPLGITRWTPALDSVRSVTVSNYGDDLTLTEPEQIEKVIALHKKSINYTERNRYTVSTQLIYELHDGSIHKRSYYVPVSMLEPLLPEYSAPEYVLGYENWELYAASVRDIQVNNGEEELTVAAASEVRELLEAIRKDCEAGIMAQEYFFRNGESLHASRELYYLDINAGNFRGRRLTIYQYGCTTAWLEAHGISQAKILYG